MKWLILLVAALLGFGIRTIYYAFWGLT